MPIDYATISERNVDLLTFISSVNNEFGSWQWHNVGSGTIIDKGYILSSKYANTPNVSVTSLQEEHGEK